MRVEWGWGPTVRTGDHAGRVGGGPPDTDHIYSQRGLLSKMAYSPEEPRSWTPRLMINDEKVAYS